MIETCRLVNFNYMAGSIEKIWAKEQNTECEYLIVIGIYQQQINELTQALQKVSPITFKAKSIAFVFDDKNGETNDMSVKTMMAMVQLQKTFGHDIEKPNKEYYIKNNFFNKAIVCARQDGQLTAPPVLKAKLDAY